MHRLDPVREPLAPDGRGDQRTGTLIGGRDVAL
jgi:hypothetical protein